MKPLAVFQLGTRHGEYKNAALWLAVIAVWRMKTDPWWITTLGLIASGVLAWGAGKVEDRFLDAWAKAESDND